jgi:ABC-type transport system substrate-binding protein
LPPSSTANNRRAHRRPPTARQPRRYFATPLLATDELAFDTKHGLFADARMRQAVNYALDRPALAAALGALAAANHLPPGLPGALARHVYPPRGLGAAFPGLRGASLRSQSGLCPFYGL